MKHLKRSASRQLEEIGFVMSSSPIRIDWCAFYEASASWPEKRRMAASEGRMAMVKKPDRDNVEKMLLDVLKDRAWVDDSQVCFGTAAKIYSDRPTGIRARLSIADPMAMRRWADRTFPPIKAEEFKLT